jgi:protein phosphatase
MNLSSVIKESKNIDSHNFIKTANKVLSLLLHESGKTGTLTISDRLVTLYSKGEALIIGDLHGNLDCLSYVLESSCFVNNLSSSKSALLIFLGDYGDRGPSSVEVYYIIMKLKLAFPKQVVLLRGNHEGPDDLQVSPYDLPLQFQIRFKDGWKQPYCCVRDLFSFLYNAVLVKGRFLMVHGGLASNIENVDDLARAHITHPKTDFLENILWSDPTDLTATSLNSPRGAGRLFGKSVTQKVLKRLGVKILIRGHEMCENGFKIDHDGKVLTLFSTKGTSYSNKHGAYLQLPLSKDYDTANQLVSWIRKI